MTQYDTIARMAIRLARGYGQAWARAIPKSAPWDLDTFGLYSAPARRAPSYDHATGVISHRTKGMTWTLDARGDIEVELHGEGKTPAWVEATRFGDFNTGVYAIKATRADWHALSENELWRIDVACSSLACGEWRPIHDLPPVRVLAALGWPRGRMTLTFSPGVVETDSADFAVRLEGFRVAGGFERWEQFRVGKRVCK